MKAFTHLLALPVRLIALSLILLASTSATSQNLVPFTKRTGLPAPANGIYTLKGDFTMMGNTNMTLGTYSLGTPNSNNNMIYADVDGDDQTINSSMAELKFSNEGGVAIPNCSRVVFAGLYWTGRSHNGGTSPDAFDVSVTRNVTNYPYTGTQTVGNGGSITYTPYTMAVSRRGSYTIANLSNTGSTAVSIANTNYSFIMYRVNASGLAPTGTNAGPYWVRYTFTSSNASDPTVDFEFMESAGNENNVRYRFNAGAWTNATGQEFTDLGGAGSDEQVVFNPVKLNTVGDYILTVSRLEKDERTGRSETEYRSDGLVTVDITATIAGALPTGGSGSTYWPRYTFSASGHPTLIFELRNGTAPYAYYSTDDGATFNVVPGTQTVSDAGNNRTVSFPEVAVATVSGTNLGVLSLTRDLRTDRTLAQTQAAGLANVRISGTVTGTVNITKTLDKRKVKFKKEGQPYQTVIANTNDIYYPQTDYGQVYSAYGYQFEGGVGDVTEYVRQNGQGNYYVADMALQEGNGGSIGYFGCWSLVVIYENANMKWRSISLFDGHSFINTNAGTTISSELEISGFEAVNVGPVRIKLGIMAGEGDRTIGFGGGGNSTADQPDFLDIRNAANTDWVRLSHDSNAVGNFFNSSIFTGGNNRNPRLLNNTGIDIAMFELPNTGNSLIANSQTSTRFRYGTSQDLYTISTLVFAVDAYVPEVEGLLELQTINGMPAPPNPEVLPGQPLEYTVKIRNRGNEAVNNFIFTLPVPFAANFGSILSSSVNPIVTPIQAAPVYLGGSNTISWNIGTLPLPPNPNDVLLEFRFRLTATTNCNTLRYPECARSVVVNGSLNGVGVFSGTPITNQPLIQGYQLTGQCQGEPIIDPISIPIDVEDYVNANCPPDPTDPLGNIEIVVCPEQGSGSTLVYPVSEVAEYFPPGTRFYNQVALPRIEFTDPGNPFPVPAVGATVTYYALPPGLAASCFIPFKIIGCDRQVFVSATPTCDKDVPYLDYVITGNYTFAPGTLAQIEWIPGPNPESGITPDPAYPTPIAVMPLTDQPLTGRLMWPGAVKDGSNVGVDWPGWVLEAGNWVFKEDGYSWYKQGGSIKVTVISPAAEVLTATQPVTYPAITLSGCNPGPPLSITGKVYKDANGMSDNEVNGIGTNAGGLFVAVVRGGVVVGSTAVDMNGDFTVSKPQGVLPNASHELILVTAAPSVGSSLSTASFPAGWSSTGEYLGAGTGSDGTPNSKLTVPVTTTSVINAKFGLCDGFANVSGTIRDADEDTLILGAMIALIPQATGLTPMQVMATGADGAFAFNNIIPGSYLVQVLDASLNARGLYPFGSTSSLAFRNLIGCQPSTVEFFYGKSPLPVLGDFVWLDVNGNDVQDEWFDANNDGFITENPNNAPFDLADWEWVDLNHNGTYDQPEDEGELNKCGFGNTNSAGFPPGQVGNIYVTQLSGDHAFTPRYQIIGVTGYWRVRPTDAGTGLLPNHGNYRAQMVVTEDLRTNGQALAQTGKCKVATGVPTNLAQPKQENEPETETSSEGLGPGDLVMVMSGPGFVDGVVTTTDPADLTMDMGVSMQVQAPSIVVTKVPSQTTYSAAGDQIQYTITVTNNGNVPIINVTVADATADGQPLYVSGDGNGNSTLDLGEAWVYTATRTITPADVTATSYTNTAIATGESTAGDPVEDDAQASVVLRNISVVATPVCIQDVPYLNFTITSNFDMTGLTADVRWLTGTPQSLPPTSPVSPIVPQVDINGVTLNVAPGGFSATGQVIWPGAVADGGGNGVDWPGWVYEDNDWFNLEDGYSGYRTNPTFRITVNPTTETTGFVYPPSSPLCLTEPPITVNGTVWRDADGSGKLNPNNIQTGTELGTDGTPNPGSDQLYANAVARGKNGNPTVVIDVTTVNPDGTYTFEHIQRQYLTDDYDFEVVLSTVQGTVGSNTIPGEGAPTQWETTVGSKLIPSSVANVFELDLGAQQLPDTEDKVENITGALGVGQIYLLDDQHLEGSDAEDGAKGAGNPFRITSLPAYANLYYNGVQITQADVTAGTGTAIISNYNPALLDIRFTAALDVNNLPITQTSFTYAAIDLANGVDPTPATYLINISSILPATGLSLSGKLTGNEVRLVWTTVTEANTSHFVVERSADGSRFSSLGNVTAAGSSQTMRSYNYEDNKLQSSQIWYYRIKLVDMDGTVRYSNVVSIRLAAITGILQVYPNPVDNRFYVTLPDNGRYKMELVNAQGQQVWTKQVTINNPLTAETIERNGMANGVYMLRVTRADGQWQQSVKIWLK